MYLEVVCGGERGMLPVTLLKSLFLINNFCCYKANDAGMTQMATMRERGGTRYVEIRKQGFPPVRQTFLTKTQA